MFKNFGKSYEKEPFTKGTSGEVDFIEKEIYYNKQAAILDVGCGTGRHLIELGSRGYTHLTGVDISQSMLDQASKHALEKGLSIEFKLQDATQLTFSQEFDLCLCLCEGAFSLLETDDMHRLILKGIYQSLKPGGKFILTALNAFFAVTHEVHGDFHLDTQRLHFKDMKFADDNGEEFTISGTERYFTCSELSLFLREAGFIQIECLGATLGQFDRNKKPSTEDMEILVIAQKPE